VTALLTDDAADGPRLLNRNGGWTAGPRRPVKAEAVRVGGVASGRRALLALRRAPSSPYQCDSVRVRATLTETSTCGVLLGLQAPHLGAGRRWGREVINLEQ
jgi:hypothetical protein